MLQQNRTRQITLAGLFAALVFVATYLIRIPTPLGYIHIGDGFIVAAGAFLGGPIGALAAGVGSMLADLIGFAAYAPGTFVIKGLMGLVAGLLLARRVFTWPRTILTAVLCELIMLAGYFVYEAFVLGYGVAAAAGALLFNAVQGGAGVVVGVLFLRVLARYRDVAGGKAPGVPREKE